MTGNSLSTFEAIAAVRPIEIDRQASLLSYIKTETRWMRIAAASSGDDFNPAFYAERRAGFTRCFAAIRNRRLTADAAFYDVVAYQAAMFRYLIEARRQRARAS